MLDGQLFDQLDALARGLRGVEGKPFGGIKLLLCGDFHQLPPINLGKGGVIFCFESRAWSQIFERPEQTVVLTETFRQQGNGEFVEILRAIRLGAPSAKVMRQLRAICNFAAADPSGEAKSSSPSAQALATRTTRSARSPTAVARAQ